MPIVGEEVFRTAPYQVGRDIFRDRMAGTPDGTHRSSNPSVLVDHCILLTIYQLSGFVDRGVLRNRGKFSGHRLASFASNHFVGFFTAVGFYSAPKREAPGIGG